MSILTYRRTVVCGAGQGLTGVGPHSPKRVTLLTAREKDTRPQVTRFQSAVIPCFDGVRVGVGEGAL